MESPRETSPREAWAKVSLGPKCPLGQSVPWAKVWGKSQETCGLALEHSGTDTVCAPLALFVGCASAFGSITSHKYRNWG